MRSNLRRGEFGGGRPDVSKSAGREQGRGNEQLIPEMLVHGSAALHKFGHLPCRFLTDRFRRVAPLAQCRESGGGVLELGSYKHRRSRRRSGGKRQVLSDAVNADLPKRGDRCLLLALGNVEWQGPDERGDLHFAKRSSSGPV